MKERTETMDDDTINILTSRAFEALTAASEAAMDALRRDLTPEDRAVRAGLARDLAAYARELFAIVRENR